HIDTWCLQQYYPQAGDTGSFARKIERYVGVSFSKQPGLRPSMYTFLWRLYELTGDAAYVQVLHHANDNRLEGLPHDLFADDPAAFQKGVRGVIEREGAEVRVGSVNKEQWHLALLRSGRGGQARVAWLDYDAGGGHGHLDGMNLGLFAKGLDLMPDFGYPPVHYGGWKGPRFNWYVRTAGHNTVVVDGRDQKRPSEGRTTLWADGDLFRAIRASGPGLMEAQQYERTVALIDLSEEDAYVVDLFRVVGGTDHAKFMHSHFGQLTTQGLALQPVEDYGLETQMRGFRGGPARPGWSADWKVEDRYQYLPPGSEVHLRYTDLTTDAQACAAEAWVSLSGFGPYADAWIPRLMVRRRAKEGPLASAFVGVIEPYAGASNIAEIRRLLLETPEGRPYPDAHVAVEVLLTDGRQDLFVAADVENPLGLSPSRAEGLVQKDRGVRLEGELCWVRQDGAGEVRRVALCRGRSVRVGDVEVVLKGEAGFIEVGFEQGRPAVVAGRAEDVQDVQVGGRSVWR
ncbi:heparinase II/III family protein, partial [bacterium]|nr:heparinase II/III family protein [bacterium]